MSCFFFQVCEIFYTLLFLASASLLSCAPPSRLAPDADNGLFAVGRGERDDLATLPHRCRCRKGMRHVRMTCAQALQCSPRLLKAQRLQIQGRGIGGLVPQDSLDHTHGLPQPVQDARGQMTNGMEAERPYPCPFAQRPHEVHPLLERLAVLYRAKAAIRYPMPSEAIQAGS